MHIYIHIMHAYDLSLSLFTSVHNDDNDITMTTIVKLFPITVTPRMYNCAPCRLICVCTYMNIYIYIYHNIS